LPIPERTYKAPALIDRELQMSDFQANVKLAACVFGVKQEAR
jgi:hypothetical protein